MSEPMAQPDDSWSRDRTPVFGEPAPERAAPRPAIEQTAPVVLGGHDATNWSGSDRDHPGEAPPTEVLATVPTEPAPSTAPPGWYDDPSGRNDLRMWDGNGWTDQVVRNGVRAVDAAVP
ncbi:MAG: DUF2510 domain-containing protein [Ilumatobacteraceae bacterium]